MLYLWDWWSLLEVNECVVWGCESGTWGCFKQHIFALLEKIRSNWYGLSIPLQSSMQCCLQLATEIFTPRKWIARTHKASLSLYHLRLVTLKQQIVFFELWNSSFSVSQWLPTSQGTWYLRTAAMKTCFFMMAWLHYST